MPDLDDREPTGEEAEAEREATVMPWIWGGIGLIVIALFAAFAIWGHPHSVPPAEPQQSATISAKKPGS